MNVVFKALYRVWKSDGKVPTTSYSSYTSCSQNICDFALQIVKNPYLRLASCQNCYSSSSKTKWRNVRLVLPLWKDCYKVEGRCSLCTHPLDLHQDFGGFASPSTTRPMVQRFGTINLSFAKHPRRFYAVLCFRHGGFERNHACSPRAGRTVRCCHVHNVRDVEISCTLLRDWF